MERRLLIASLLTLVVWFGYAEYLRRTAPPPKPPSQSASPQEQTRSTSEPAPAPVKREAAPPEKVVAPVAPLAAPLPEKTFAIENDLYHAVFTSRGGRLKSFELKAYKNTLKKGAGPVNLVQPDPKRPGGWPLGLRLHGEARTENLDDLDFEGKRGEGALVFTARNADGLEVTKSFTFEPSSYVFTLEIMVRNATAADRRLGLGVVWQNRTDPHHHDSRQEGHVGPVALVASDVERLEVEKIEGERVFEGPLYWAGFETKYFLAALIPDRPEQARVRISKPDARVVVSELSFPPGIVPASAATSRTVRIYAGPKSIPELKRAGAGLEDSIAFGFFAVLAKPLLWILFFFERFVGNYGVAIILLTILVRLAFYPLASKQFRSMKEMQRLQPLIQELKEKHGDDREKMNQEMMQLYRTHKVNPLGGCLPILVQIPVFIALYQALLNSIELRQAPFIFWIKDLSAPDHTYITPILMTGSMFLQQKMSPPMADPAQQRIMMFMPLIFGFMFLNFPSGLVLYWLVNNLLSIAQQYWINRQHG